MIDFNYKLINPLGEDFEDYKKIHQELFKSAAVDFTWVHWYHNNISSADIRLSFTRTYGLYDGKRLIGIWSVEPKLMRDNFNTLIKVGRCFAVGVSADYRRMGLFVKLSEFAIQSEKERGEYQYILGFPQTGRSVIGGHLKAGWEEISFVDAYSIDLNLNDTDFCRKDVNEIFDFSTIQTNASTTNSFDETAEYRNIRFIKHPKLQYFCYSCNDAYIVLKPYSNFCHILEIKGSNDNVKTLLEVSKSICKRHGFMELNVWNNPLSLYNSNLIDAGFTTGAEHGLPITIIAVKINAKESLIIENSFNFGMGVEEGY